MNLSLLIFPDSYEVLLPCSFSRNSSVPRLTGKLCIIASRPIECQSIELELRGDLTVDHQTSFDVLNNLIEGTPPPIVHIYHEVAVPAQKLQVGHTIIEYSIPLVKKMPPSYEGSYASVDYTLGAKMRYRKWMAISSLKSALCSLKFKYAPLQTTGAFSVRSHSCCIQDKLELEAVTPTAAIAGGEGMPIELNFRNGTRLGLSITAQIWQIEKSASYLSGPKRKNRLQYETRSQLNGLEETISMSLPSNLSTSFKVESTCSRVEVYHLIKLIMNCDEFTSAVCIDIPIKIIGITNRIMHRDNFSLHELLPAYEGRDSTLPDYEWFPEESLSNTAEVPAAT
ncbi:hypothetical protein NQZ79_g1218 [Umbelopsis isabellina]|nr:hypothetical protein NQZ79_g1218 [Umbelopsis isabellina]